MKRYLIYFFLLLIIQASYAQTGSQNYVLQRTFKQTGAPTSDISKVNIQVQYLDGLGRPLQTVSVGQGKDGTDIITPIEYDAYGRQPKNYLPYAGGGNGAFQSSATGNQGTFYSGNTPQLESSDLARPYTETTFENAPAARPLAQRAPGNKSAPSSISYTANDGTEVKRYIYTANADITQTISQSGTFAAGQLYKTSVTDENAKLSVEYTDTDGRLICKKAGAEALTTYYVFDDYGLLRAVLQPKYQDNASAADFAFLYDYDGFGRVISKKVPGSGKVDMVYDNADRLVMSQDANQLARGVWGFVKYDGLNRPAMTGELSSGSTRSVQQAAFDASSAHHEDKSGSGIGYSLGNTLPSIAESNLLTVTYYDDYDVNSFPGSQAYVNVFSVSTLSNVKPRATGGRNRMLNVGAAWLVGTTRYDAEYRPVQNVRQLYDLGVIGIERVSTKYKYDLAPVVDQEKTDHESSGAVTNSLLKTFDYDHADRLLSVKEKVTVGAATPVEATTLAHRYNILGQLKEKWLYSTDAVKFRTRTDYVNNIRGWITEGKNVYKVAAGQPDSTLFAYQLSYGGANYTNGNISQMMWRNKGQDNYTKGLNFTYDGVNRLSGGTGVGGYLDTENGITYDKNGNIGTLNRAGAIVDNLTYTYAGNRLSSINDASGNITGVKGGASSYGYDANGNIISDGNKGTVLTYNYLNLPKTIAVGGNTLTYDYDASGTKHKYSSTALTVKYAGPFEYDQTNAVKRVSITEGQAVYRSSALHFDTYIKDHLGNVRVVIDDLGATLQKTDYYSFGLEIARDGQTPVARNLANRYNFLGKETQVATGYINLSRRFYDPTVGRFIAVDPVTSTQEDQSTYQYGWNNPILQSDPNGDCPRCPGNQYLKALSNPITTQSLKYASENQKSIGSVKFGVGFGEGYGIRAFGREAKIDAFFGHNEIKIGSGGVSLEANALKMSAGVDLGAVKPGAEVKLGNLNIDFASGDGSVNLMDGSIGLSREQKGSNAGISNNGEADASISTGPFSVGVSGSFEAIRNTVSGYIQAVGGYVQALTTEITNNTFRTDPSGRSTEQFIKQEREPKQ